MIEIRALLLTDVVDSTRLAEQLGDVAMAELWAVHDRMARELLPLHGGREIDKTDGFLLLFDAASDAAAYAVAYHRALRSFDPPLLARAGLHVGQVILTETPAEFVARGAKPLEVDGLAKPTAARVMSVAAGGQTLATAAAVQALGASALRVESHGHWRIKGVLDPVELFEIGDPDAAFRPPPDGEKVYRVVEQGRLWLPAREIPHSLPAERDPFVGRQQDLAALAERLGGDARLVSVLGTGGTGKTRLVTHYGWTWLGDHPGGVWFCDLSEARGVHGIASAVARALGVPLDKDDPIARLGHALAGRGACLVILDNFEQVARHAAETLGRWLDRAVDARFVATSREVLGLPGEVALALAPLPSADGVALFVARAQAARRDFAPDDPASIEALVKLLDGLPLAIELAAARVRVMDPKTLLSRMSQRFKLLASTGGRHTRQATLRATLDWSWELLAPDEQRALAQLSVFEGGFTLGSAEAVLSLEDLWPTDAVQALVDKSLVRRPTEERFDLLVSVQEYAAERLEALGDRDAAQARHGVHFSELGTDDALDAQRLRTLTAELDNLVVATSRAIGRRDAVVAQATLRAAWRVLSMRGPAQLGATLAAAVLDLPALAPHGRATTTLVLTKALLFDGRAAEARERAEAALGMSRGVGDRPLEATVLRLLGGIVAGQGRFAEARELFEDALAIHREVGDRSGEGAALGSLGSLHASHGRPVEAREFFEAALAVRREVGDVRGEAMALGMLGILHRSQGRPAESRAHLEAALTRYREVGDRTGEGRVLETMGGLEQGLGRLEQAREALERARQIHAEVGNRVGEGVALGGLGTVDLLQGQLARARVRLEAALDVHREVGNVRTEVTVLLNLAMLHLAEGRPDDAAAGYQLGRELAGRSGDRQTEGLALGNLGGVYLRMDRLDEARACLEDADVLLRGVGAVGSLAGVLCRRVHLAHREGNLEAAAALLREAEAAMDRSGLGAQSSTAGELAEARALLG